MTVFEDIAQAVVTALDGIGRFASGAVGDDQKDSTAESMEIIAEAFFTGVGYFAAFGAHQDTAQTVNTTGGTILYKVFRRVDKDYYLPRGPDLIDIQQAGKYHITYAIALTGGTGTPSVRSELRRNGIPIAGAFGYASWDGGSDTVVGGGNLFLDLEAGDTLSVFVIRTGAGSGTVQTIPNGTSISIFRASP